MFVQYNTVRDFVTHVDVLFHVSAVNKTRTFLCFLAFFSANDLKRKSVVLRFPKEIGKSL